MHTSSHSQSRAYHPFTHTHTHTHSHMLICNTHTLCGIPGRSGLLGPLTGLGKNKSRSRGPNPPVGIMENNCLSYDTSEKLRLGEPEGLQAWEQPWRALPWEEQLRGVPGRELCLPAFPVLGVTHGVVGRFRAACSRPPDHAAAAVATDLPASPGRAVAKLLAHPNATREPSKNTRPGPATGRHHSKETLSGAPQPWGSSCASGDDSVRAGLAGG